MKLSFSKPTYSIGRSKEGKVIVTCVYKCTVKWYNDRYDNRFTVIGKATCNPSDKEDERIGKMIAESRAKRNAYKHAYITGLPESAIKRMKEKIEYHDKIKYLLKAEKKHLEYIMDNINELKQ